jgi:hypothetical protein
MTQSSRRSGGPKVGADSLLYRYKFEDRFLGSLAWETTGKFKVWKGLTMQAALAEYRPFRMVWVLELAKRPFPSSAESSS